MLAAISQALPVDGDGAELNALAGLEGRERGCEEPVADLRVDVPRQVVHVVQAAALEGEDHPIVATSPST